MRPRAEADASPVVPWWTVFRDPGFITRRALSREVRRMADSVGEVGLVVDVGCGSRPYESMFRCRRYLGLDVPDSGHPRESKKCDVFYDGVTLPIADAEADVVLCTQVLEHASDPSAMLSDIARVLRPGGSLVLTAPLVWPEHETPYDFRRYTSFGLGQALAAAGLEIVELRPTTSAAAAVAQLNSLYIHGVLGAGVPVWSSIVSAVVCAPVQIVGLALGRVLPGTRALYLDNAVLARRPDAGKGA